MRETASVQKYAAVNTRIPLFWSVLFTVPAIVFGAPAKSPQKVEFNRDVRPILSENCFKCHGFDKKSRDGDRRLDVREGAFAEVDGVRAVVPGNLAESDLHVRIHAEDPDDLMPPPKSACHCALVSRELRRWRSG